MAWSAPSSWRAEFIAGASVAEGYLQGKQSMQSTINGYDVIALPNMPGDRVLAIGGKLYASPDAIARLSNTFVSVGIQADEATKALVAMSDALQSFPLHAVPVAPEPYDARRPLYDGLSTKSIQDETPAAPVRRAMRLGKR